MNALDYLFLGLTMFVTLVLADLCSSAIKWHIANYKLRRELNRRKEKLSAFSQKLKKRLLLKAPEKDDTL